MKTKMLAGLVKKLASTTMGSCASKPNGKSNAQKRRSHKSGKRRGNISSALPEMPLKRVSNAGGNRVGDFSLSDFVHLDFDKAGSTTCRISEVSNGKFHLTQLQYHSQIDTIGIFSPSFTWYNQLECLIFSDYLACVWKKWKKHGCDVRWPNSQVDCNMNSNI